MSLFQRNTRYIFTLGALSIAVALAACGGGDDPVNPPPAVTLPVVVPASLDYTQPGSFNYTAFVPDGLPGEVPVTVAYNASVGSLTLKAAGVTLVASTTDGWAGVTWTAGYAGLLALGGNASLVCKTADNSGQVGISGNLTRVTDLAELRGKTFQYKTCANGVVENDGGIVFNADGSAVFSENDGEGSPATAAEMAAYFSDNGSQVDGVYKALAYSRATSNGKEYVIVDISDDPLNAPRNKTVSLLVEIQAPK